MNIDRNKEPPSKIRVLLSLAPPDGTTRFVDQLTTEANPNTQYRFFTWRTALLKQYDVFHIHWPEFLLRSNYRPVRLIRFVLFSLLLVKLKLSRTAVVRTLHNMRPHEAGTPIENYLLARCDDLTTLDIRLNEETPPRGKPLRTILHGHYKGRFPLGGSEQTSGRILYFGIIRPYKGVEQLIHAFGESNDPALTLRILGSPTTELRTTIEQACNRDRRISCDLRFVPDDVLANELQMAELIVLPYREMHNSGAILVALSLARRVLVPRSKSNELLDREVGPGWIYMFDGELTNRILLDARIWAADQASSQDTPLLSQRDWSVVGQLHYEAYAEAVKHGSKL